MKKYLTYVLTTLSWFALVGTLGAWERGTISTVHFIVQFALSVGSAVAFGMAARKEGGNGKEL